MRKLCVLLMVLTLSGFLVAVEMPGETMKDVGVPASMQRAFSEMQLQPLNLGFCEDKEWQEAVLGDGFPIYRIDAEALVRPASVKGAEKPLHELAALSGQWYFPVMTRGRCVAMLFASREGDEWRVDGLGHAGIAREWSAIRDAWREADGYRVSLLRSMEGRSDLMLIQAEGTPSAGAFRVPVGYVPLASARVALGLGTVPCPERALLSESQFVDVLRVRVREAMPSPENVPETRDR